MAAITGIRKGGGVRLYVAFVVLALLASITCLPEMDDIDASGIYRTVVVPRLADLVLSEHSMARHGSDAVTPVQIMEKLKKQPFEVWWSTPRGQWLFLIYLYGQKWAGAIVRREGDKFKVVTAFIADRCYWDKCITNDKYVRLQ